MIAALRRRLAAMRTNQTGFTLIELLVASAMGVVLMGAVGSLVISAVRDQPKISRKAADVQTARFVMERLTRELRQGVVIDKASASSVSFQTYVRRTTCGGTTTLPSSSSATRCEVTYSCSASACTRLEAAPGVYAGTPVTIVSGLANGSTVFTFSPATTPTYVGINLNVAAQTAGAPGTTVSDGASLRNATLGI
jgi:prepilin-type N-terminal cleavage/methylation domain-containing protein